MKHYAIALILLSFTTVAKAELLDVEDVSKESDAAMAENNAVKENLAKEKSDAERAQKAADEVRKAAQAKKSDAIEEMKKSETEIQSLTAEQNKIKEDVARMKQETEMHSKELTENKQKLEKARQELAALQQLRSETNKKLVEIAAESDKVALELKEAEHGKAQAVSDFQQLKSDTKASGEKLAKMKEELTQKRAQAAIAAGDAKGAEPQSVATNSAAAAAVPTASSSPSAGAAAAAGTTPIQVQPQAAAAGEPPVQREISSEKSAGELVFKRDCKVYDRISRDPQIIGQKPNGSAIVKTDETKYWIGFALSPSQKGFVAKTCF